MLSFGLGSRLPVPGSEPWEKIGSESDPQENSSDFKKNIYTALIGNTQFLLEQIVKISRFLSHFSSFYLLYDDLNLLAIPFWLSLAIAVNLIMAHDENISIHPSAKSENKQNV